VDLENFRSSNAEQWPCCTILQPADTFTPSAYDTMVLQPTNCRYFCSLLIAELVVLVVTATCSRNGEAQQKLEHWFTKCPAMIAADLQLSGSDVVQES